MRGLTFILVLASGALLGVFGLLIGQSLEDLGRPPVDDEARPVESPNLGGGSTPIQTEDDEVLITELLRRLDETERPLLVLDDELRNATLEDSWGRVRAARVGLQHVQDSQALVGRGGEDPTDPRITVIERTEQDPLVLAHRLERLRFERALKARSNEATDLAGADLTEAQVRRLLQLVVQPPDPEEFVLRRDAAWVLASSRHPAGLEELMVVVERPSATAPARAAAMEGLARAQVRAGLDPLIAVATDLALTPELREAAVYSLGLYHDVQAGRTGAALAGLERVLERDPELVVRQQAVTVLGRVQLSTTPTALEALVGVVGDEAAPIPLRQTAVDTLMEYHRLTLERPSRLVEVVPVWLGAASGEVQPAVLELAGAVGDARTRLALLRLQGTAGQELLPLVNEALEVLNGRLGPP